MEPYTYEIIVNDSNSKIAKRIGINGDEMWIPMDESNSDYQAYLAWLETEEGKAYLASQKASK